MLFGRDKIEKVFDGKFVRLFDIHWAEGKHYFDASRRDFDDLMALKSDEEARNMLPDAVSIIPVLHLPNAEPVLLLQHEYRYPAGRFVLSVPAGLIDPADKASANPLFSATIRELSEETGLKVKENDKLFVVNPGVYSTPGLTDECNALVRADLYVDDLSELSQAGAEGSEIFDGFSIIDREKAKMLLKTGRDEKGQFYALYTWAALMNYLYES